MNARSEGDETPLWLDAHACQEARSGGTNAPEGRAGIAAHYVEGAGASTHSHSECIVVRSRAFVDNPG